MLRSGISDVDFFVERLIALDNRGAVWKDKVYKALIDEFQITDWSVDELLQTYLLTFCVFCRPGNGAVTAIEAFRCSSAEFSEGASRSGSDDQQG